MRWGHAMVRPMPGFLWGPERLAAQESLGEQLHFAHSDLGGLALFEEASVHFEPLPPPTQGEVERLLKVVRHRV